MKFVGCVLVALSFCLLLVGCETTQVVKAPPSGGCVLKQAGEMPRQKLRYTAIQSQMEKLECTNKLVLDQSIGPYSQIFLFPSLRYVLLVKVLDSLPDGRMKIVFTIDFVQAVDDDNNPVTIKIKPLLAELPMISGSYLFSPLGEVKDNEFAFEPGEEEYAAQAVQFILAQILTNMACHLPREPVGIGAVWTYELPAMRESFSTTTHVQVTLVGFKAQTALLKFSFYQSVEDRHHNEQGIRFELIRHIVHGQGENQMTPGSVVPTMQIRNRLLQRIGAKEHGMKINITNKGLGQIITKPYADL